MNGIKFFQLCNLCDMNNQKIKKKLFNIKDEFIIFNIYIKNKIMQNTE